MNKFDFIEQDDDSDDIIDISDYIEPEPRISIFDQLFELKVCFAVCIGFNVCKGIFDFTSKEYFLTACISQLNKLKPLGFYRYRNVNFLTHKVEGEQYPVCIYDLSPSEVAEFRHMQYKFTKVVHNKLGRVYELCDKSFSTEYKLRNNDR